MTARWYLQTSYRSLAQAREALAVGGLLQASEKAWDAAVQMLKAVADERGWEHSEHRHHLEAVSRLRGETGDPEIRSFFNSASSLRENFYANTLDADEIAEALDDVAALCRKLAALLPEEA